MRTWWQGFWLIVRLWKGRKDNPLLAYYDPRRRNLPGIAFRLGEFFALASLGTSGLMLLLLDPDVFSPSELEAVTFTLLWALVVLPTMILFVAPGPWSAERSTDLRLTTMTTHEVAFGFLFWPLVFVAIMAVGAGVLTGTVAASEPLHEGGGYSLVRFLLNGSITALGVVLIGAFTLERWFTNTGWRWAAIVTAPMKAIPVCFLVVFIFGAMVRRHTDLYALAILCLFGIAWTLSRLDLILYGAGERIMGRAAVEPVLQRIWRRRDRALSRLPDKGREAKRRFYRAAWKPLVVMAITGAIVSWGTTAMAFFLETQRVKPEFWFGLDVFASGQFCSFLVIPASSYAAIVMAGLFHHGRVPLLSGGLLASAIVYTLPLAVMLSVPWIVMAFFQEIQSGMKNIDVFEIAVIVGLFFGITLVMVGGTFALLAPGRLRLLTGCLLSAGSLAALLMFALFPQEFKQIMIPLSVYVVVMLAFLESFLQRIHRAELLNVPLGRLNTDPPLDGPLIPEQVVDELAMRG